VWGRLADLARKVQKPESESSYPKEISTGLGGDGPFEQADFEAPRVISLVERCGVIGNVFPELEQLCALVKVDPKDVRERLYRMQKTNGLVARAGRYFYVTPTPIAMVCFQAAWSKWAELAAGRRARMMCGLVAAVIRGIPLTLEASAPPAFTNGLEPNASSVAGGRRTRVGMRSDSACSSARDVGTASELAPRVFLAASGSLSLN
jgi:hypothetical protein